MPFGSPSVTTAGFSPRSSPMGLPSDASTRISASALGRSLQVLAADGQFAGCVAVAGALLGDSLIEAERGGAAAVAEQDHPPHALLAFRYSTPVLTSRAMCSQTDSASLLSKREFIASTTKAAARELAGRHVAQVSC